MPFCNWCHLDSDTPDVCAWCKRPFNTGPGLGATIRPDIHLLKVDDDPVAVNPLFPILGVLVFVAVLGFVWLMLSRTKPAAPPVAQNPAEFHLGPPPSQGQNRELAFLRPFQPAGAGTIEVPKDLSSIPPDNNPQFDFTHRPTPWHVREAPKLLWVGTEADQIVSSYAANSSIYFQSADFQVAHKGSQTLLVGRVVVVNDTAGTMDHGLLWLQFGGRQYHLQRFREQVGNLIGPFAVASKDTIECDVMARNFQGDFSKKEVREIGLDARIAGAPVHYEAPVL